VNTHLHNLAIVVIVFRSSICCRQPTYSALYVVYNGHASLTEMFCLPRLLCWLWTPLYPLLMTQANKNYMEQCITTLSFAVIGLRLNLYSVIVTPCRFRVIVYLISINCSFSLLCYCDINILLVGVAQKVSCIKSD